MKDLPHARAAAAVGRAGPWPWSPSSEYFFQTVAHFGWSDDRLFSIFSLVTVAHFA
jgi:hypothetical protein